MIALKNILGSIVAASVLITSTAAFADDDGEKAEKKVADKEHKKPAGVPELSGKGAPAALLLIASGAAIVLSRRRRQS